MPRYDVRCPEGHTHEIMAKWDERTVPCLTCAAPTARIWVSCPNIIGDSIDYVDTNMTAQPIRFTSKSERKLVMKQLGIREKVRHAPLPGGDKSSLTTKWY